MALKTHGFGFVATWLATVAALSAQVPAPQIAEPQQAAPPTFRVQVDVVTMDVIVRDSEGRFVPDLTKEEFEVYEDGVRQEIASMTMSHGGRVTNILTAAPPAAPEGVILPPRRVSNDTSGRIFLFFVDDLHLQFGSSGRVREIFKRISRELVHEGDMFGIVSSGPSSIAVDMTYDKKRLEEAIEKIHGDSPTPTELIQTSTGTEGLTELRHRAHVSFATMHAALENLARVQNRRKALVWVTEGYDFNPFQEARLALFNPNAPFSPFLQNQVNDRLNSQGTNGRALDPTVQYALQRETFSDADLAFQLGEVTRAANRANTTIYTIDPRGLVAGTDLDQPVNPQEWDAYVRKSQDTMRVLAEDTGGIAIVNSNDIDRGLERIDAEVSDYYVLGYYSSNPDVTKRRRRIEVRVLRPNINVQSRTEYVVPLPAAPTTP
ncbi:MAG: VWA domain-containing protein [Vicinamibacterales bacterium]